MRTYLERDFLKDNFQSLTKINFYFFLVCTLLYCVYPSTKYCVYTWITVCIRNFTRFFFQVSEHCKTEQVTRDGNSLSKITTYSIHNLVILSPTMICMHNFRSGAVKQLCVKGQGQQKKSWRLSKKVNDHSSNK